MNLITIKITAYLLTKLVINTQGVSIFFLVNRYDLPTLFSHVLQAYLLVTLTLTPDELACTKHVLVT